MDEEKPKSVSKLKNGHNLVSRTSAIVLDLSIPRKRTLNHQKVWCIDNVMSMKLI